jgi:Ion channel
MRWLIALTGGVWIVVIVWDTFEAVVLPRRVTRRFRTTRMFFRTTWRLWSAVARRMHASGRRETYLSFYGPLSLLLLFAAWAASLIAGFAMVQFGLGTRLSVPGGGTFVQHLYMSGETFFTLGLGDVAPLSAIGRGVLVIEAGMGFGFLALVIGYMPILYQAFSRREVEITLLDARAGSPPSAEELLRGHGEDLDELSELLREWERWCADVLESHLSYPVLSFYRSQHDNQSWLAALTAVVDTSVLVSIGVEGACQRQARLTFAMARHTVADLAQVLGRPPVTPSDRLPADDLARLRASLAAAGVALHVGAGADEKLAELRRMYEPYVEALSRYLIMPLPPWRAGAASRENWRTTAWGDRRAGRRGRVDPHEDD